MSPAAIFASGRGWLACSRSIPFAFKPGAPLDLPRLPGLQPWATSAQRSLTAGSRSGRTAKAVVRSRDRFSLELGQIRDLPDAARSSAQWQIQHLVEIAVVQAAVVANRNQPTAHQPRDRIRIEMVDKAGENIFGTIDQTVKKYTP